MKQVKVVVGIGLLFIMMVSVCFSLGIFNDLTYEAKLFEQKLFGGKAKQEKLKKIHDLQIRTKELKKDADSDMKIASRSGGMASDSMATSALYKYQEIKRLNKQIKELGGKTVVPDPNV